MLAYFLVVNSFYMVLLIAAGFQLRAHKRVVWQENLWRLLSSSVAPSISVLAPAHNEMATVSQSVRALLALNYPNLEVILVNDGSRDATLEVLIREFDLTSIHPIYQRVIRTQPVHGLYRSRTNPGLLVVDKENGGKADALNAGLNVATGDLVCAVDADTLIEPDALLRMVRPFLRDREVVAAGGTIRVVNRCDVRAGRVVDARVPRHPLSGIQVIEYLRAFLFGRLGWNALGGNLIISGAFGLFRRQAVITAGGYLHESVGEDMELVVSLRRRGIDSGGPHKVRFIPDPVAWTEVPEARRILASQRERWHRGLADVMWRYRRVLLNPHYGALGMVVFPYFFFVELLAPAVEAAGLAGLGLALPLGAVNFEFAALFLLLAYGYGLVLSVFTLLLDELSYGRYRRLSDRLFLFAWLLLESFGYRQMTVLWRLRGIAGYLRRRTGWGVMARRGFDAPQPPDLVA